MLKLEGTQNMTYKIIPHKNTTHGSFKVTGLNTEQVQRIVVDSGAFQDNNILTNKLANIFASAAHDLLIDKSRSNDKNLSAMKKISLVIHRKFLTQSIFYIA